MALAQRLMTTRLRRGLTQDQAAAELGCHPNSYRLWEMGAQRPGADRLWEIVQWCKVDAETLLREIADERAAREVMVADVAMRECLQPAPNLTDPPDTAAA